MQGRPRAASSNWSASVSSRERSGRPPLAPTHEYYYIISGRGIMKIGDEEHEVRPGDLVYTPPDTTHSIWPASDNAPLHGLAFAIGVPGAGPVDYTS